MKPTAAWRSEQRLRPLVFSCVAATAVMSSMHFIEMRNGNTNANVAKVEHIVVTATRLKVAPPARQHVSRESALPAPAKGPT